MSKTNEPIYSFGENDEGTDRWYAHKDGVHIKCNKDVITHLWKQWLRNKESGSIRIIISEYNVYESITPLIL